MKKLDRKGLLGQHKIKLLITCQWQQHQNCLISGDAAKWIYCLPILAYALISRIIMGINGKLETNLTATVDHFIPKSIAAAKTAYERNNYRLASSIMNNHKGNSAAILDPFTIQPDTVLPTLTTGEMRPNDAPNFQPCLQAWNSIKILNLNGAKLKRNRAYILAKHLKALDNCNAPEDFIKLENCKQHMRQHSPFVLCEIQRQGFLEK
jgi:hypothetical protein